MNLDYVYRQCTKYHRVKILLSKFRGNYTSWKSVLVAWF